VGTQVAIVGGGVVAVAIPSSPDLIEPLLIGLGVVLLGLGVVEFVDAVVRRPQAARIEVRAGQLRASSAGCEGAWSRGEISDVRTCLSRVSGSGSCLIHLVVEVREGPLVEVPIYARETRVAELVEREVRRALGLA
jgi:hypothetical protein